MRLRRSRRHPGNAASGDSFRWSIRCVAELPRRLGRAVWEGSEIWQRRADLRGKHAPPTNIHEHLTCPSITAGGGGAAPPIKMAQVLRVLVCLVTAAQPAPVTLESVTETPDETP